MNLDITAKEVLQNCLNPPDEERVDKTVLKLSSLEAIDLTSEKITPLGILLNRFGVDPEIARMLFYSCLFGLYDTISLVAAALSHKSPFTKVPDNKKQDAKRAKTQFDAGSDMVAMARCFQHWVDRGKCQDFAYDNFLSSDGLRSMERSVDDFSGRLESLKLQFPQIRRNERSNPVYPALLISGSLYPKVLTEELKHLVTGSRIKIGQESLYTHLNETGKRKQEKMALTTFFDILRIDDSTTWLAFDLNYMNHTTLLMFGSHGVRKFSNESQVKLDYYGNESMLFEKRDCSEYLEKFRIVKNALTKVIMHCSVKPYLAGDLRITHFFDGVLKLISEDMLEYDPVSNRWL